MNKKKLHKFFNNKEEFAPNERLWLFCMLMLVAGFFGGFTFSLRGRVFVNAQTGNLVFFNPSVALTSPKKYPPLILVIVLAAGITGKLGSLNSFFN